MTEQDHSPADDLNQAPTWSFRHILEDLFGWLAIPLGFVLGGLVVLVFVVPVILISDLLGLRHEAGFVLLGVVYLGGAAFSGVTSFTEWRAAQRAQAPADALTHVEEASVAFREALTADDRNRAQIKIDAALRNAGRLGATPPLELPGDSLTAWSDAIGAIQVQRAYELGIADKRRKRSSVIGIAGLLLTLIGVILTIIQIV